MQPGARETGLVEPGAQGAAGEAGARGTGGTADLKRSKLSRRRGLTPLAGGRDNPPTPRPQRPAKENALDPRLRRKLEDLGRALSEVIADSSEVSRQLDELREEGFSLYLLLESRSGEETVRQPAGEPAEDGAADRRPAPGDGREPSFRINGRDLVLLRSLGIDPTRSLRRRRAPGH